VGAFSTLKASGMKFAVQAYRAEGLGHVSVMRAKGFFGLMKMDTLMIVPSEKDLPLYSYDRIYAMGNDTLIVELYDTLLGNFSGETLKKVKDEFAALPERDPGEHWYDNIKLASSISKKGKKEHTQRLSELALRHFDAYLASPARVADGAEKRRLASEYVEGLLSKGGPSTDVFKKHLGDEKCALLFRKILFGTVE
jgi:hypothetical protein